MAEMAEIEPLVYSIPQAAAALGVSEPTVARMIETGRLPVMDHMGRRKVISRRRLEEWVYENGNNYITGGAA